MNEIIIGIDLGTTNSEVAVLKDGAAVIVEGEQGHKILPSVVGLNEANELLVGQAAKNQQVLYPENTVSSIKRKMGSNEQVTLGGQSYLAPEISAMILKKLKANAEAYLQQPVKKAVITVPAYFSDQQRQATREAGELAGLEVVRIINEPTAAALAYQVNHEQERKVLVYDLGGGTFDVSVVSISQGVVEVLASHGNNHLGGDDFDCKLIEYILEKIYEQHKVDASKSLKAMARIKQIAEKTKIHLSDHPYYQIEEAYLLDHNGEQVHLSLEISRDEYEKMIHGFIHETIEAVHIALRDAQITVQDIEEVLLVGGSTKTPLVSESLQEIFHHQPHGEIHPDLCVAMGAAIQAAAIAGQKASTVLVDITPYTFGTSAIGPLGGEISPHMYVPVIKKNTPIPVTKSEIFYTTHDFQDVVQVEVYQGEDHDARNNHKMGDFEVTGLREIEGINEIVVQFHLDVNGILHVTSEEKATGKNNSITITNALHVGIDQQLQEGKEKLKALFHESDEQTPADAMVGGVFSEAETVLQKAKEMLDNVVDDDKIDLIDMMESLQDHLKNKDVEAVKKSISELNDLIYYLESATV